MRVYLQLKRHLNAYTSMVYMFFVFIYYGLLINAFSFALIIVYDDVQT
jgi:hypothetical protein